MIASSYFFYMHDLLFILLFAQLLDYSIELLLANSAPCIRLPRAFQ